jgi:hypothetical protein
MVLTAAVGMSLGIVLLTVWLVRLLVPHTREGFHAEISAPMLGVVAALFGLLLAFVIIIAYENFLDANANVSEEADALAAIVRNSGSLPGGERVRISVGDYVREVVRQEWPEMRAGNDSPRAHDAMTGIYAAFRTVKPDSPQATAFYEDSIAQLSAALDSRRDRLEAAEGGLPTEMAALILFSTVVIVAYAVLVGSPNYWFHALGPAAIAVVVAFSLVVLADLSYPFSGDVSISPDDFTTGTLQRFFPSR